MAASTAVSWEDTPRGDPASVRNAQIASLTGLRGFAALMVVVIHTSVLTEYSWLGVPEYGPVSLFVLSGYLLYRPWARWGMRSGQKPSVREFARRRLVRIFPAYLTVLFIVAVIYPEDRPEGIDGWFRAITLTWIYVPEELRLALFQTWSLGTELSWYAALPVLGGVTAWLTRRSPTHRGFWVGVSMISLSLPISAAWRAWVDYEERDQYFTYSFWLPAFLFCFGGGALVAQFVEGERAGLVSLKRLRAIAADRWTLLVLALTFALLGTSSIAGPNGFLPVTFVEHQVRVVCAALVALTLLINALLAEEGSPLNRLLSTRWFNAIGRWSYGIYLWHLPVIVILERDITFPGGPLGLGWRLVWVLVLAVPLGAATYSWVERPTMAWSRRRISGAGAQGPGTPVPVSPDLADSVASSSPPGQSPVQVHTDGQHGQPSKQGDRNP